MLSKGAASFGRSGGGEANVKQNTLLALTKSYVDSKIAASGMGLYHVRLRVTESYEEGNFVETRILSLYWEQTYCAANATLMSSSLSCACWGFV